MIQYLNSFFLFIILSIFFSSSLHSQAWTWAEVGQDIIDGGEGRVSLSSDGKRVATHINLNDVRVYEYNNNTWTQLGQDIDVEAKGPFSLS